MVKMMCFWQKYTRGIELDIITMTSGYNKMIDKPTHYINDLSVCIDLVFSSNVNFTKYCGVEQWLYQTSQHSIIYRTLNFNIPLSPPYYTEIWNYKNASIRGIQKSKNNFDWARDFQNWYCNEKFIILSKTLLNIFHNFILHKIITRKKNDYKNLQRINKSIKLSLKKWSKLTKRYNSNPTANNKEALVFQAKGYTSLIIEYKEIYIAYNSAKLDNP